MLVAKDAETVELILQGDAALAQVAARKLRARQIRPAQADAAQVSTAEIGAPEVLFAQVGAEQDAAAEIGSGEHRPLEVGAGEIRLAQVQALKRAIGEVRIGQAEAPSAGAAPKVALVGLDGLAKRLRVERRMMRLGLGRHLGPLRNATCAALT